MDKMYSMRRSFIARFIDNTVICLIAVLLCFVLLKSFIANNLISLTLSLLVGLFVLRLLLRYQNKKFIKLNIESEEKINVELTNFELRKLTFSEQLKFLKDAIKESKIINKSYIITNNGVAIFNCLDKELINSEEVFYAYGKVKNKADISELVIISNGYESDLSSLIKRFKDIKIYVFDPIETYALLKKYNCLPNIQKTQKQAKNFKIQRIFAKKQGKNFIKCGFLLFVAGLLVPFTKYYTISAAVFLFFGAICLCFGSKEYDSVSSSILLAK